MSAAAKEATVNVVIGCFINWFVLYGVYDRPWTATGVMLSMIALTWLRSFLVRLAFARWA